MPRNALKKDRWIITFDRYLKNRVQLLESLVRERLDPCGFQSVRDSIAYVNSVREKSRHKSDRAFLSEIQKWQKR